MFFFFQAEDGIRYYKVTGVQTCALPILDRARADRPVLALAPVTPRRRAGLARPPRPARRRAGAAVDRDARAPHAVERARGPPRGLRAHRAGQGPPGARGRRQARPAERPPADRHARRDPGGSAHGRRGPDRDRVRVAGARAPDGEGDLRPRLRALAGRGARVRARVRPREPAGRSLVRPPRPPHLEAGMSADAARRFGRNRLALLGLALVAGLVLVAAAAPLLAPQDPVKQRSEEHTSE